MSECFRLAKSGEVKSAGNLTGKFSVENDLLVRDFRTETNTWRQTVVPEKLRPSVLSMAHDTALAGHCGARRTLIRMRERFFWPGMTVDTTKYVSSCNACQKAAPKGRVPPVPLAEVPRIDTPFERIAIDIVGPFTPASDQGHKYILTIVDIATRYPEAIPMRDITSEAVADALFGTFTRLGFPHEILSDRGTQFNSELTKQFYKLCGCKGIRTSPYHPQANGNVERFHGTLKPMLRKVVQDKPKQWHKFVPALLFACMELPSESTWFSPFRLLFGREVRGPITLLSDVWTDKHKPDEEDKDVYRYVFELQNTIWETCQIAAQNSQTQSARNKTVFDKKTKDRKFQVGDEVLLLLPSTANKLLAQWKGPSVKETRHPDYIIDMKGKQKLFHANMLKSYQRRAQSALVCCHALCEVTPIPQNKQVEGHLTDWDQIGTK